MRSKKILALGLLAAAIMISPAKFYCRAGSGFSFSGKVYSESEKFFRAELYFGMNKPDGTSVSDDDWNKFLAAQVTPRFPDGLTVLKSYGQYKNSQGAIIREESRVLILLYSKKTRRISNQKIEEIRAAYKKEFQQESVLRMDFTKSVSVSF